jgi:hypothetical protein
MFPKMLHLKNGTFLLRIILLASLFSSFIEFKRPYQQAKITGTWNFAVETSGGSGNPTFIFKQDTDTAFTGTYKGQLGEAPVKGTIKGKEVKFSFTVSDNLIEYTGIWEGNNIKGSVKLGSMAEGTFSAIKKE